MRTIAIAALLAAPALTKNLAQAKDDTYAAPKYEAPAYVAPTYKDDSYEAPKGYGKRGRSASKSSRSSRSSRSRSSYSKSSGSSGSNYSVSDHDQYHNNEDNNQSPYVANDEDTTTQNVNFRINLLKNQGGKGKGQAKKAAY